MENKEMFGWMSWFRAFGAVLLFLVLEVLYMDYDTPPQGVWEVSQRVAWVALLSVTAVGLILHRRWAAALFALAMVPLGVFMMLSLIGVWFKGIPIDARIIYAGMNIVIAVFPSYITMKHWRALR